MDLTFEEQIKLRDIARKMTRARTIEEKWKREQEMDKLLGIYKSNTKMLIYLNLYQKYQMKS
ncbi:hypothetical protein QP824_11100 [Staphylococcus haemolyticus]|uniref:hypothetical protein n=1 Tax=Staphylococcus haemolyticus TaxID=1283 RepID=UPI0025523241|nr:hypothetical protein [Staphylococcus haemolyticus]MDK8539022.1 hypothetical protein [Staphylococcus haemolyticus]